MKLMSGNPAQQGVGSGRAVPYGSRPDKQNVHRRTLCTVFRREGGGGGTTPNGVRSDGVLHKVPWSYIMSNLWRNNLADGVAERLAVGGFWRYPERVREQF